MLGQDLAADDSHGIFDDKRSYRELIGSLLYVANFTRPEGSSIVSTLLQYLDCPRQIHWREALHVLQYLKGTLNHGLHYYGGSSEKNEIKAYADANWGGDKKTRRSTYKGVVVAWWRTGRFLI